MKNHPRKPRRKGGVRISNVDGRPTDAWGNALGKSGAGWAYYIPGGPTCAPKEGD